MDGIRRSGLLALLAAGLAATGCNGGNNDPHVGKHNIYFMGTVIDGVLNAPLTSADPKTAPYAITLVYGNTTVQGKVEANGRYTLGPLPAWNDYGVIIDASNSGNYRPFSSYNGGLPPPLPPSTSLSADIYTADTTQTLDYDAVLFPTSLSAPDVTLTITKTDQPASAMPSAAGTIRIQPTSASSLQAKTSGEVAMQVWANSQDLFASAITDSFTAGTYTVSGAKLVYGVSYTTTIYGVDGYQPNAAGTGLFQAGITGSSTVPIAPLMTTPLPPPVLVSTSGVCHTGSAPVSTTTPIATTTLTFNVPVADGTTTMGGGAEALDNSVTVVTSGISTLKSNLSATVQERGASLVFSGNTVTIGWTPSGLATPGPNDIVEYVYYQNLSNIYIQQPNHTESRVALSSFVGTSVTCGP